MTQQRMIIPLELQRTPTTTNNKAVTTEVIKKRSGDGVERGPSPTDIGGNDVQQRTRGPDGTCSTYVTYRTLLACLLVERCGLTVCTVERDRIRKF